MINIIILISLILKLGIPPFHFWIILISKHLTWDSLSIILTIQKIIPFYIFSLIIFPFKFLFPIIIISSILPPIIILNLLNFKKLITYSSVNQSIWIIILIYIKNIFWFIYILYYSTLILSLSFIIKITKLSHNIYLTSIISYYPNLTLTFLFINIARMPPFSFFIFKWFSIFIFIINSNIKIIIIILIIRSLIILFIYLNIINSLLFSLSRKSKLIYIYSPNIYLLLIINFFISIIILLN